MRIAIEARELMGKPTGVGRYLSSLLTAWSELPAAAAHEFVLCTPEPLPSSFERADNVSVVTAPGHGTLWQQFTLPRLIHGVDADVIFAPAYSGPLMSKRPMVVSVHDVSFAAHPEWFGRREGLQRRVMSRLSARRASRVLTFSDFSKREIVSHFGVPPDRVEVIYHGLTTLPGITSRGPRESEETAGASADAPVVLYAGSLFNRRHIPELIAGFSLLASRHRQARLEVVGENRTMPVVDVQALVAGSAARDQIHARSYVEDAVLAGLYREATAFIFCSDYEGFGMTPLEALAAGVPIIVLDTAVTREIYGPAAHYVARPEPALIAAALERVLFDRDERARILRAAPDVLARYSWQECGRRTLQILLASAAARMSKGGDGTRTRASQRGDGRESRASQSSDSTEPGASEASQDVTPRESRR
jgi:glycosyltransferase involved in cell wall biosynthesis